MTASRPELVNVETGELITVETARDSVQRARGNVAGFWREVQWQVTNRAWEVLGYDSFDDLWTDQYAAFEVSIPRHLRPELAASLRAVGQTQQQIANKLGVGEATVRRDLSQQPNGGSDPGPQPTRITNLRGQERPATYQRPAPRFKPMPPPIPPPDTAEARQRDSRNLLRRVVDMVALDGRALDPDSWAQQVGDMDDDLADLIARAEVSGRVLIELAERKRS